MRSAGRVRRARRSTVLGNWSTTITRRVNRVLRQRLAVPGPFGLRHAPGSPQRSGFNFTRECLALPFDLIIPPNWSAAFIRDSRGKQSTTGRSNYARFILASNNGPGTVLRILHWPLKFFFLSKDILRLEKIAVTKRELLLRDPLM